MKLKTLCDKTKYVLAPFAVLALLSLIYDGFKDPVILALRLLVCVSAALFFSSFINDGKNIFLPSFAFLAIISCNTFFLTDDMHILLSLTFFLLSLSCDGKLKFLSPVFAGLCIITQPLTILFFIPSIVGTLLLKKEKILSLISAVVSAGAFVLTKSLADAEFYADQFCSYYLSVHLVHFSNEHTESLTNFVFSLIPVIAVLFFFIISFVMKKKIFFALMLVISAFLGVWGFAMSGNVQTVIFTLLPLICSVLSLYNKEDYAEIYSRFNTFFKNHLLLFLLSVAFVAGYPLLFGQAPFDSEFFSKVTFIIFRQE